MKKYKLYRTIATITLVTALSTGISNFASERITTPIPYTQQDIANNIIFNKELQEIMNEEEIIFNNQELKEIIEQEIGEPITKESLSTITILSITNPLKNNDLSDLKYLTNLNSILLYNNEINLQDLQYNQDLFYIIMKNCQIKNSTYLPNSINHIKLENCKSLDSEFIIPYYTQEFESTGTIVNNIKLKNPSYLEKLSIYTDVVLDLNNLKDCTNLKELSLLRISNIKNAQVLKELPNLENIILDEYASIWLDLDTLKSLPLSRNMKEYLSNQIVLLDNLANTIIPPESNLTPEEKTQALVLYLLDKFEYDFSSVENYEFDTSGVSEYNDYPISSIIEKDKGVCINYACMFTALANRVGLDTFQLYNDVHTWNSIKTEEGYKGYDLSYLEYGAIVNVENLSTFVMLKDKTAQDLIRDNKADNLYFYEFDINKIIDNNHNADYTPQELKETLLNIGYINDNSLVRMIEKDKQTIYKLNIFSKSYIILLLLSLIIFKLKDKISKQEEIALDFEIEEIEETKVLSK